MVLKSDNGSHFTGGEVPALLAAHRVEHLLSPPYYNGAIEAGIGALKDRTAARAGHPEHWTWEDTAGARQEAAEPARPQDPDGPSPAAVWPARSPILAEVRALSGATVTAQIACGRGAGGVWSEPEVARRAIRLALEGRGYLQYLRRRLLPPITGRHAASNP